MRFYEDITSKIELIESPEKFAILITEKFCGDKWNDSLTEVDKDFLSDILNKMNNSEINYRQLNEILLILNQDTISNGYFKFIFDKEKITLNELLEGIKKLRGYFLLRFGNFRYPYKSLRNKSKSDLCDIFKKYHEKSEDIISRYQRRPDKMLKIERIRKEDTWCLGYLTGAELKKEGAELKNEKSNFKKDDSPYSFEELTEFSKYLYELEDRIVDCQKIGLKNTDIYLTWDYIDVYIATSMRNQWEFEEVYDFIEKVFNNEIIMQLKLRYFDPTQSFCGNPKDKGLVEGLMLKRADCTIYLAQESDTMGKDSELASTLAQGKPVIVYVPDPNPEEYARKIRDYPLFYFKTRFLSLDANNRFDDPKVIKILKKKFGNDFEEIIQDFLDALDEYRQLQPYSLWFKKDNEFKESFEDFDTTCNILAEVECYHFDKRANTLRGQHPLAMQVELNTGVANGVLVVRNSDECAELLMNILTNEMQFNIEIEEEEENALGVKESYTLLKEKISKSPYRIVTHQERLTNSFWNNFWR